jgi:hypothetical protein
MNKIMHSFVAILIFIVTLSAWIPNSVAKENLWMTLEPMPTARYGLEVAVVDGKIYAIGGNFDPIGANEEYTPATNSWTTKTPMPTPRINFAIAVVDNKIYTIGGDMGNWTVGEIPTNIVEVYDH